MSSISEVKQKLDIVEIVGQYTALTKAGKGFRGLCPFHSEKHGSFFVYPEQQTWHCFGACSTGGDIYAFMMKKENLPFADALKLLAERAGVTLRTFAVRDSQEANQALYQANEAAALFFHNLLLNSPAGEKARNYLAGRGFSPQSVQDFQIGLSPEGWEVLKQFLVSREHPEETLLAAGLLIKSESGHTHDRFRARIMFPIHDIKGRTIGFGARSLDGSEPKYLNSPQSEVFDKGGGLFALDHAAAAIRSGDLAVIVEGYVDVVMAHQHGFRNVVASMGTAVTEKQVSALKKLTRNLLFALDSDKAGEEAMLRCAAYESTLGNEIRVLVLPEGQDPDDIIKAGAGEWQALLKKAQPVVDYTFSAVLAPLDLSQARGKSLASERLLPLIMGIQEPVRQVHYLQKLARILKVDMPVLGREASQLTGRKKYQPGSRLANAAPAASSHRLEEDFLALLVQHPEYRRKIAGVPADYFESSENREVFRRLQAAPETLPEFDPALGEHLAFLQNFKLLPGKLEERYARDLLRLREKFLKNREAKRAEMLAMEAERAGSGADLARLEAEDISTKTELLEVFKTARGGGTKEVL